jgi:hypothetical protein
LAAEAPAAAEAARVLLPLPVLARDSKKSTARWTISAGCSADGGGKARECFGRVNRPDLYPQQTCQSTSIHDQAETTDVERQRSLLITTHTPLVSKHAGVSTASTSVHS